MLDCDSCTSSTTPIPSPLTATPSVSFVSPSEGGEVFFQCPFRGLDGCRNGVGGRGLLKASLFNHLKNQHYKGVDGKDMCWERIRSGAVLYKAWDSVLLQLKSWLFSQCMHVNAWGKKCKLHQGDIVSAPDIVIGVDALSSSMASTIVGNVQSGDRALPSVSSELLNIVFQANIPIVSSIPPKCRLHFARVFKTVLQKVIALPNDLASWIHLLLFPICTLHSYTPQSSQEEKASNRKNLQVQSINLSLSQWDETNGCMRLVEKLLEEHGLRQKLLDESKRPQLENQDSTNLRLCRNKLRHGLYAAVIRTLTSSGVALDNEGTLNELRSMHPTAAPPRISSTPVGHEAMKASTDLVVGRLKSFPKGTSCGWDGFRAQHFLDALSGSAAAISEDLIASITDVVNLWLSGSCPPALGEFVASAPLTPLVKPGGDLRPIAIGTIWRRMVSKCVATHVGKEINAYLGDFQFGVGAKCGGEAILHAVNRMLEEKGGSDKLSMLLVDLSNAFNLIDCTVMLSAVRKFCPSISRWVEFCYASPARLYYMDHILSSSKGVQQGDSLGPLLFALTLHLLAKKIAMECEIELQAWYLDDGTLIGDTPMVAKDLKIIQDEGVLRGLRLNIAKTELFWPTPDPKASVASVFPPNISRPSKGVKLLGGPVSLDAQFNGDLVVGRVRKTIALIDAVEKLEDPQGELLLFRNCASVSRLYFTLRTTRPEFISEAQDLFDTRLVQFLRHIITGDGPGYGLLQQRLSTLPFRHGGLGVYTMQDTKHYCFLASCLQTLDLQSTILRCTGIEGVPARKEVDLGFLANNGTTLRPADIFIYNWDDGHDMCFDVTGVSSFTGGGVRSFVSGLAIKNAVTRKNAKYLEKCTSQGYGFRALSFTTLGELGDDVIDFLKRLRNYIASHDPNV
ncbi:uncharacterized protein LOC113357055 isoform X2 [Papaver somniferum]|uniref:uncharacterized protein LOC113357055 isoform X2 n=1 Tax=Papaver somniferum TaxID=3469 RepID=UPI000E6FC210|nr:uncharacterized protein LOC113357055 isoform X2 [Papaver somniferum]